MRRALLTMTAVLALATPVWAADAPRAETEVMLRQRLAELAVGELNLAAVSDEIAKAAAPEIPAIAKQLQALGPVQSVTFRAKDKLGSDVYDVRFAHGAQTWVIRIGPDGRAAVLLFQPA